MSFVYYSSTTGPKALKLKKEWSARLEYNQLILLSPPAQIKQPDTAQITDTIVIFQIARNRRKLRKTVAIREETPQVLSTNLSTNLALKLRQKTELKKSYIDTSKITTGPQQEILPGGSMARQNIDEKWKSDPRRKALVKKLGSERLADGMRVEINWLVLDHKGKPVPLKEFKFIENWEEWIDSGLAEVVGDDVRIAGADRYDEFFGKQKSNGSKGGRPRKPKKTQKNPNAKSETQKNPENPSFSFSISSSSSFSSSDSTSGSEFKNSSNSANPADSPKPNLFVAAYCDRFKQRWGEYPQILDKDAGIAKRLTKNLSQDRFENYLDAFFSMPDAWLVKTKHPLSAFETKLNEIVVFANSGNFTTTKQARDADSMASNALLLQKIREGKV